MAYDSAARNLIVTARPEDHAIIKTTVEELDKAGLADRGTMQVYPLKQADPNNVYTALLGLYRSDPSVKLTADAVGRSIIAVAGPEEQQLIQQMIEKLDSQQIVGEGWTTEVYHFQAATPLAAEEYLEKSVPQARIVVDTPGRNLIITASVADHETIKRTIEQMDQSQSGRQGDAEDLPAHVGRRQQRVRGPAETLPHRSQGERFGRHPQPIDHRHGPGGTAPIVAAGDPATRDARARAKPAGLPRCTTSNDRIPTRPVRCWRPPARGRNRLRLFAAGICWRRPVPRTTRRSRPSWNNWTRPVCADEPSAQIYALKSANPTVVSTTLKALFANDSESGHLGGRTPRGDCGRGER